MPRPIARKFAARPRIRPILESLEARQLLTASPVPVHAVHAEVTHPKPVHHAKPAHHAKSSASDVTAAKATTPKPAHAAATSALHTIKVHNPYIDINVVGNGPTGSTGPSQATYSPVPGAYNPTQLETAYGVNLLGVANQGQGVTIAIVDELNDANIISDANVYSSQYNLPQFNSAGGPTLTVKLDTTFGSVASAAGSGVAEETSLDVEMVHAMAPKANILLVEVPAPTTGGKTANTTAFKELLEGVQEAAATSGVVAVSLSYGLSEGSFTTGTPVSMDNTYLETGAAQNVAVTVSTGDGSTPLYPATTPDVVAVGGTSLYLGSARGKYGYETAWGGLGGAGAGGGGASGLFSAPTFQSANGVTLSTKRTIPDVSLNADPVTAASVYDSLDASSNGGDPWFGIGGTSEAAPLFAGVLGLAQQDRLAASLPILDSVQVDNAIYKAYNSSQYATYFHDITLGNNSDVNTSGSTAVTGYSAATGYDLATGVGSPIASTLVQRLASS